MVPAVGDMVFVPNLKKGTRPGTIFDHVDKRGGFADVGRVTEGSDGEHYVAIVNFGGMEFRWEGDLEDQQEQLKEELSTTQAGLAA